MNYRDPALQDRLAASYVLGEMKGAARRRFAHLMRDDAGLRQAVEQWEQRLLPLTMGLEPKTPPARVWQGIATAVRAERTRSAPTGNWWSGLRFWHSLAGGLAMAVLALAVSLFHFLPGDQPPVRTLAVLASSDGSAMYVMNRLAADSISVQPLSGLTPDAAHALELWAIAPGQAPRSLGLLRPDGITTLDAVALPASGDTVAISLEPPGGSPTGAPTGPVILTGKLS